MDNKSIYLPLLLCLVFVATTGATDVEDIIIQCDKPCAGATAAITAIGGTVTYRYENIGAIAARVPAEGFNDVMASTGVEAVYKDVIVPAPNPGEMAQIPASEIIDVISGEELTDPQDYLFDNDMTGASVLHAGGTFGFGVIVAVIDSGTANNPFVVPSWVGSTIAADAGFLFFSASALAQSVAAHAPGSSSPFSPVPGTDLIPMVGSAPGASLYAMKVFPATGGGAPESRIIAAMDRAITLKRNFDNGVPSVPVAGDGSEDNPFVYDSLNIQVVNMSLGGPTLFAGEDLEDSLTRTMLEAGIVLAASAGNEGHTAMTVGSPGTGKGSLTVAASSSAAHERILRDVQFGFGIGALYRPSGHVQTAAFSSRGPNADGRIGPNVTANGFANFAQGANGGLSVVSGTSFSAPTVAGAAALLIEAAPSATAAEIRAALIATADPTVHGDNSGGIDQGAGFINIPAALDYLQSSVGSKKSKKSEKSKKNDKSAKAKKSVKKNIDKAGFKTVKFKKLDGVDTFSTRISDLVPGQVAQFFVESKKDTSQIVVSLDNVDPELPAAAQNPFFGDDLFVQVADAPTSIDDKLLPGAFITGPAVMPFDNPQTGIVRVAVMGDWTNAGRISTDLVIQRVKSKEVKKIESGDVEQGELNVVEVEVPPGTTQATFELCWKNHWGAYPTDDLDMILVDPASSLFFEGATLSSPERVVVDAPAAGTWTVFVDGFTVHGINKGPESKWELRAYDQDGNSL
jgi:hypothetical protein